jgi:hypothetical protein
MVAVMLAAGQSLDTTTAFASETPTNARIWLRLPFGGSLFSAAFTREIV